MVETPAQVLVRKSNSRSASTIAAFSSALASAAGLAGQKQRTRGADVWLVKDCSAAQKSRTLRCRLPVSHGTCPGAAVVSKRSESEPSRSPVASRVANRLNNPECSSSFCCSIAHRYPFRISRSLIPRTASPVPWISMTI